jgi:hypothetical protein
LKKAGQKLFRKALRAISTLRAGLLVFFSKSFDRTFSKGGWHPQPMRVPEIQSQTGLTKKFVSLANFYEVLVKVGPPGS